MCYLKTGRIHTQLTVKATKVRVGSACTCLAGDVPPCSLYTWGLLQARCQSAFTDTRRNRHLTLPPSRRPPVPAKIPLTGNWSACCLLPAGLQSDTHTTRHQHYLPSIPGTQSGTKVAPEWSGFTNKWRSACCGYQRHTVVLSYLCKNGVI